MEKKKKPANYIIPAAFFQALSSVSKEIAKPIQNKPQIVQRQKVEEPKPKLKTPVLKSVVRRSSSLSLKSIHQKKDEKKLVVEENFDNYPKDVFTEKLLQELWSAYVAILNEKGEKSMASIVGTDIPKLEEEFKISFTVPNKLMADQFKKGRSKLLTFLRKKLNNYGLKIIIIVNETIEKKFAYTPIEKFNKMKEMNPLVEKLRQTFELDM
jgi:DNA polymerase-3 subunit gamma/tau